MHPLYSNGKLNNGLNRNPTFFRTIATFVAKVVNSFSATLAPEFTTSNASTQILTTFQMETGIVRVAKALNLTNQNPATEIVLTNQTPAFRTANQKAAKMTATSISVACARMAGDSSSVTAARTASI